MAPKSAQQVLAENVQALMKQRDWSEGDLAKKAGIDKKTVNNMVNGRHSSQTDSIEAVALAFGLLPWELLVDGLGEAMARDGKLGNIIEAYTKTDDRGRESILTVAEIAMRPYLHRG